MPYVLLSFRSFSSSVKVDLGSGARKGVIHALVLSSGGENGRPGAGRVVPGVPKGCRINSERVDPRF